MPRDDESLGEQHTYEGGAQPADSSDRSLGDRSTFGGGVDSSLSDIGGLTGDADLDMEIVDLSRYEVQETLGKGGMGEVLLATDTRLNRKVAIKRMLGDAVKSQTAVKRFLTEAQSIAALNHFNIVQIHDYGRDKDGPFLIMEYVGGGSLLDKCRERALPLEEAVELMCQLCDGLSKAHDAGIIHRDIKPANILLTTDGLPKLTDFGLARQDAGDTGQTVAGAVLGTLDFMPPEQRRDATQTDARSDLWSLAATLYQLVTGEPPRVIDLDEVPQQLRTTLSKALKTKPDARYQSAREFRDALRATTQTASQPIQEPAAELGAGECPKCHTKNEASRKFCSECAVSLEAECLSCSAVIPMWEKVCNSCGTKQTDLLDERRSQMAADQSEAESLLKNCEYDRATELAAALRDEPDLRLQHLKGWAETFLPQIEQGRQRQLEQIGGQLTEAAAHEQAHDFAAALRVLEEVPEALRAAQVPGHSDTVSGLMSRLQSTLDEIKRLDTEIRQRLETRKFNGLLSQVNQLLELQPDRRSIQDLKTKLQAREDKVTAKVTAGLAKARSLRQACRFESALTLLEKMPEDLGTLSSEISDLKHDCGQLANLHEVAMRAVEAASAEEMSVALITGYESDISGYRNALTAESLEDPKFLSVCDSTASKLSQLRGANEQQRKIRLAIAGAAGVLLLIAVGLWVNSFLSSRSLASAIEGQQWDEVLQKDGQNVTALLGRANQRLTAATPNIEGAFVDIGLAEQVDFTNPEIKSVKALAYAKRATSLAQSGKISDAEKDLKEAETLGASDSQLTPVRQLLAAAYVKQAEEGVARGDAARIRAACNSAEQYHASSNDLNRLRAAAFKAEGEQKAKSGDLSGALAAFDEAVKLDGIFRLSVKTERAVLHVKLGEQAVAKQDYQTADTWLNKAVTLDKSATGVVDLAVSIAEHAVTTFETGPSKSNQLAAIAVYEFVGNLDASRAVSVKQQIVSVFEQIIANFEKDLTASSREAAMAALKDLESFDAQLAQLPELRRKTGMALVSRSASLTEIDVKLSEADWGAARSLGIDPKDVPKETLSQLPLSVLSQLPPRKNSLGMEFKLLPGGTFTMGEGGDAHQVTLTKPFELGVYEVTQEQYEAVMGTNPTELGVYEGPQNPVANVYWYDAVEFCRKLSELPGEKSAGYVYRLPTEAEWEYACRAGTTTKYSFGDSDSELGDYAWYSTNSGETPHPVGGKKPNAWGLYDMHGNVYEWCQDGYGDYPNGSVTDPTGPTRVVYLVFRGGCWLLYARNCRSANRDRHTPDIRNSYLGFRVLRSSIK